MFDTQNHGTTRSTVKLTDDGSRANRDRSSQPPLLNATELTFFQTSFDGGPSAP